MRLGAISLWGQDVDAYRAQLRLAEQLGYEVVGIGDSPAAWQDVVVSLTIAALETERATLAPVVTTPFLRHPVALARAMLSLADLAGDRVVLGFGGGGSAPAALGRGGGTLAEVREYVLALRALFAGERITWDGRTTAPLVNARPLRIFLAADGPRHQQLAGEIADGVIVNMGMAMDVVDRRLENIRGAARAAGRNPDDVEVWAMTYASVRERREDAIADIAAFLAIMGSLWMEKPYARALVPPELEEAVDEMRKHYDPTEHVVVGGRMANLVQELGLTDFLAGLCAVAGTPAEVQGALAELERRGVSCVLAALPGQADPDGTLRRFAEAAGF